MQVKKILQKLKILDISKLEKDIIYDSVDLNTINNTETGSFNISCQNKPFEGTGGIIETIKMSENYAVQKAINASNGDNYQRLKIGGTWQPWIANIETITNENGTAIKFADGIMICYGSVIVNANSESYNLTFPYNFINSNYSISLQNRYSYSFDIIWSIGALQPSSVTLYSRNPGKSTAPTVQTQATYIAIGRWK